MKKKKEYIINPIWHNILAMILSMWIVIIIAIMAYPIYVFSCEGGFKVKNG